MAISPSIRSASSPSRSSPSLRLVEQALEHERLAEHRRGLGQRQRRRLVEDPLRLGERGVQAVAELVGHGEHVAPAGGEVQQHVGVHARHRVAAEGATALVRAHRGVDPVLVEEAGHDAAGLLGEGAVGVEHQLARLGVGEGEVLGEHGRRAVVVGEPVDPQQLGLQRVPALRDVVAAADRLDQRHHRLVGGLVGQVAGGQPVRVGAQPVLDRLVVGERVVDEGAGAQARARGCADTASAAARRFSRSGDCRRLRATSSGTSSPSRLTRIAVHSSLNRPAPGALARDRLLGQQLLLALAQQVRPVAAKAAQVVAAEVELAARSGARRRAHRRSRPTPGRRTAAWSRSRCSAPASAGAARHEPDRRCRSRSEAPRMIRRDPRGR